MNIPKLALWFSHYKPIFGPVTEREKKWSRKLKGFRKNQFLFSRGMVRQALSQILEISPLLIPLNSPPGIPPELDKKFGYLNFSHCKDALLIGLSDHPIGVDIERADRKISYARILERYYSNAEYNNYKNLPSLALRKKVLDLWVVKEAAIKSVNGSISDDLSRWEFIEDDGIAKNSFNKIEKRIFNIEYYDWNIAVAFDLSIKGVYPSISLI